MHLTPQDFSHPGYTLVKSRPNAWEGSSPLNRYDEANYCASADECERVEPP